MVVSSLEQGQFALRDPLQDGGAGAQTDNKPRVNNEGSTSSLPFCEPAVESQTLTSTAGDAEVGHSQDSHSDHRGTPEARPCGPGSPEVFASDLCEIEGATSSRRLPEAAAEAQGFDCKACRSWQ